jgi:hypothetical protein
MSTASSQWSPCTLSRRNEPKASQLKAMAILFGVKMDDIEFEVGELKTRGVN